MEQMNKILNKLGKMPFINNTTDDGKEGDMSFKLPKAKFQSTNWAQCIVTGTKDDTLAFNKKAMSAIRMHYHDVVSLVGPPGVGMLNYAHHSPL